MNGSSSDGSAASHGEMPLRDSAKGLARSSAAGSTARTSDSSGAQGHQDEDSSVGQDASDLGQRALDFWFNLCLCHTLIVEEEENGPIPNYQACFPAQLPPLA
jgi:hypothetical protein